MPYAYSNISEVVVSCLDDLGIDTIACETLEQLEDECQRHVGHFLLDAEEQDSIFRFIKEKHLRGEI